MNLLYFMHPVRQLSRVAEGSCKSIIPRRFCLAGLGGQECERNSITGRPGLWHASIAVP